MYRRLFLLLLISYVNFSDVWAQKSIEFICSDSITHEPISFCNVRINKQVYFADGVGKIVIDFVPDTVEFYAMGFCNKRMVKANLQFVNEVKLFPRVAPLKEAIIKPTNPLELIQASFAKSDQNHLPYQSYSQEAFMREAYYEGAHLMRMAESGLRVYQTRYIKDDRGKKYFKYNSIALIQAMRNTNDSATYEKVIDCVGNKWRNMLYSRFSATGYVKGVNLLNTIYTYCLDDDDDKTVQYKGVVPYDGEQAHYIEIHQAKNGKVYQVSKLYLQHENLSVMAFEINATDGLEKINLLGFKERLLAWLFGVKFKVHKYYVRIQFKKKDGKYLIDDVAYFLPIEFWRYGNRLIGYATMQYKFDPVCKETSFPNKSAVIEMNKKFQPIHTYHYEPTYWKHFPYFAITKDQLEIIKSTAIRNSQFK